MNVFHKINHLSIKNNLSKRIIAVLKPFLYVKKIKKQESLLMKGDVCKNIYFVQSGAVKQFYISDGKEFVQNLFIEGNIVVDFNSLITQTSVASYFEALEGTELFVLSYHNFKAICAAKPEFSLQMKICISRMNAYKINLLLRSEGRMRCRKFLENESQVSQNLPQKLVASYLGIPPETLSKIRKRMSLKKAA
jgi:CRP-like cAMP-binding protein